MSKSNYSGITYYERITTVQIDGRQLELHVLTDEENERDDIIIEHAFAPLYEFNPQVLERDEIIAKRLCSHTVIQGKEYELLSSEVLCAEGKRYAEFIVHRPKPATVFFGQKAYDGRTIRVEFRELRREYGKLRDCPLHTTIEAANHMDVIDDFLSNDVIDVPGIGQKTVDSREIDHDRNCYVIYYYDSI